MTTTASLLLYHALEVLSRGEDSRSYIPDDDFPRDQTHPWDKVFLTKQERKGRSYEEVQALRKEKYEALKGWKE